MTARRKKRRPFKAFRTALEAPAFRLAVALVPRLPRPVVLALARLAGAVAAACPGRHRALALENLAIAFPSSTPAERRRIFRRSCRNFALVMLDLLWFLRRPAERIARHLRLDDTVEPVRARVPLVGVTGHLGNWELVGRYWAAASPGGITSVAMPVKNPAVDALLTRLRQNTGQVVVPRQGALRALVHALRNGSTVGLLLDQNTAPSDGGVFVPFFGLPVPVSPAAGLLSRLSRRPVAVAFAFPLPSGDYLLTCPRLFAPEEIAALPKDDLPALFAARLTAVYEQTIRERPDAWLWSYKRWKFIPPGADPAPFPSYARPTPVPEPPKGAAPC